MKFGSFDWLSPASHTTSPFDWVYGKSASLSNGRVQFVCKRKVRVENMGTTLTGWSDDDCKLSLARFLHAGWKFAFVPDLNAKEVEIESKGGGKRKNPEKTRRSVASSCAIPTCEISWEFPRRESNLARLGLMGGERSSLCVTVAPCDVKSQRFVGKFNENKVTPQRWQIWRPIKDVALSKSCGAAVAERLAWPPPTKANRAQSLAGLLSDFRMWESCRTMPLEISRFPRPFNPALLDTHLNHPHRLSRSRMVRLLASDSRRGRSPDFRMWESCRMMPLGDGGGGCVLGDLPFSPHPFDPTLLHDQLASPSSALKASMLRATEISTLHPLPTFRTGHRITLKAVHDSREGKHSVGTCLVCVSGTSATLVDVLPPVKGILPDHSYAPPPPFQRPLADGYLYARQREQCSHSILPHGIHVVFARHADSKAVLCWDTEIGFAQPAGSLYLILTPILNMYPFLSVRRPNVSTSHELYNDVFSRFFSSLDREDVRPFLPEGKIRLLNRLLQRSSTAGRGAPFSFCSCVPGETRAELHHHPALILRRHSLVPCVTVKLVRHVRRTAVAERLDCPLPTTNANRVQSPASAGMKGRGKRKTPEETRRPAASSDTIPTCEDPGGTPPGI
ncbi:hypothetical protein PR048_007177 [Dryococelus australis]|uniref:Uncharacterized protein n=1 Tax=Dryococelus australis TaxID=614101 RepID=A0ABQ9IE78_9NEOP|nr:hypothetical protein PR048_007177 [Dryococelus australis]